MSRTPRRVRAGRKLVAGIAEVSARRPVDAAAAAPWLDAAARAVLADVTAGRVIRCEHRPGPSVPLFASLARPGLVTCGWCTRLLFGDLCDRCHQRLPRTARVRAMVVTAGTLGLFVQLCATCDATAGPGEDQAARHRPGRRGRGNGGGAAGRNQSTDREDQR
ncbi:hypothetical protein [Pseudofrankia asymbiotica]|uniref:Uncharacterized protein n=1 Tax=Pseudofrankia asymbiotica TaxID=1834516 RepID=A0A1V2IKV3_9ACTN|nr:hypothetical protein [Pseudofrankia asymbiotica]ONH33640.1 hypothetical protein BL253_01075 [Pseudofrankia asymbiotica]